MPFTDREIAVLTAISSNNDPAGTPIAEEGRLPTASNVYATVVSWTVSAGNEGDLHELSMISDNLAATEFRLTIGGVEQWTNRVLQSTLSLPWRENRLATAVVVLLEARSPDNATAIIVDGSITGTERPV